MGINILTNRLRKWAVGMTVSLLIIATLVLGWPKLAPVIINRRARRLSAEFEEHPTDKTARKLADLIDTLKLSPDTGAAVLRAFARAEVVTRDAYAIDRPVRIALRSRFPRTLALREACIKKTVMCNFAGGNRGVNVESPYDAVPTVGGSWGFGSHDIKRTGQYHGHITVSFEAYKANIVRRSYISWREVAGVPVPIPHLKSFPASRKSLPKEAQPLYTASVQIPFTLNVVEPEKAETVAMVTNARLDAAMRKAIKAKDNSTQQWRCNNVAMVGGLELSCTDLPMPVSFRLTYCDKKNPDLSIYLTHIIETGNRYPRVLLLHQFAELDQGRHEGIVTFTPDPDAAYQHLLEAKEIWGGTLAVPVTFTVTKPGK